MFYVFSFFFFGCSYVDLLFYVVLDFKECMNCYNGIRFDWVERFCSVGPE